MEAAGKQQAEALLGELAALLDTPELAFDGNGVARMAMDDVLVEVEFAEDGGRLLLLSPLGKPEKELAECYGRLLDANFYGLGTADATIARDPATQLLVLQRPLALASLDLAGFEAALGSFVSAAEILMNGLEAGSAVDVEPATVIPTTAPSHLAIRG